ncbi:uncharacterized protein LOC106012461 [Aplysia californica]|uniref:Uncharacterized protein LOC106012461 n=1 Tax=Aplysia californica TaxID=6500 RepID=A0ABM1A511_APLCA|nr:uncharacterized protein LOC106012461 [Aplysia californica]
MKVFLLFAVLFAWDQCMVQCDLGPLGDPVPDSLPVTCPRCDKDHSVPGCLDHEHTCHHDEVCAIKYGSDHRPEFHCREAKDCLHDISHPLRNCTGGGVEVKLGHCQRCCADDSCVNFLAGLLKAEANVNGVSDDAVFCPGDCLEGDLQTCVDRGRTCDRDEFCRVKHDDHEVKGECKHDGDFRHCQDELRDHECGVPNHHGHYPDECYSDCCNTRQCLDTHFGAYFTTTTAAPTTTQPPPTVPTTTQPPPIAPTFIIDLIVPSGSAGSTTPSNTQNCMDQLAGDGCKDLMKCQVRLAPTKRTRKRNTQTNQALPLPLSIFFLGSCITLSPS